MSRLRSDIKRELLKSESTCAPRAPQRPRPRSALSSCDRCLAVSAHLRMCVDAWAAAGSRPTSSPLWRCSRSLPGQRSSLAAKRLAEPLGSAAAASQRPEALAVRLDRLLTLLQPTNGWRCRLHHSGAIRQVRATSVGHALTSQVRVPLDCDLRGCRSGAWATGHAQASALVCGHDICSVVASWWTSCVAAMLMLAGLLCALSMLARGARCAATLRPGFDSKLLRPWAPLRRT